MLGIGMTMLQVGGTGSEGRLGTDIDGTGSAGGVTVTATDGGAFGRPGTLRSYRKPVCGYPIRNPGLPTPGVVPVGFNLATKAAAIAGANGVISKTAH